MTFKIIHLTMNIIFFCQTPVFFQTSSWPCFTPVHYIFHSFFCQTPIFFQNQVVDFVLPISKLKGMAKLKRNLVGTLILFWHEHRGCIWLCFRLFWQLFKQKTAELYAYFVENYRYLTGNPREENLVRRKWQKKCHPAVK